VNKAARFTFVIDGDIRSANFFASFLSIVGSVNFDDCVTGCQQNDPEGKGFSGKNRSAKKITHVNKATNNGDYPQDTQPDDLAFIKMLQIE